jgi:phosphoribosylglycinamide formyltransferase-1
MEGIIIFATGSREAEGGGGTGFRNLVKASRDGRLGAKILGVVSNHENGSVLRIADELGIPFIHFQSGRASDEDRTAEYKAIVEKYGACIVVLSGWLLYVSGLDGITVVNVHPAPLPRFGGMCGLRLHQAVLDAGLTESELTVHYVNSFGAYDTGKVCFRVKVAISPGDTANDLQDSMKKAEHIWYPKVFDMIIKGEIRLEGDILHLPEGYLYI